MRYKGGVSSNPTIECGKLYATPDGGRTWNLAKTYTYNPVTLGRPYAESWGVWDETHPGPPYHSGGPFHKFSFLDDFSLRDVGIYTNAPGNYKYVGGFVPSAKASSLGVSFTAANLKAAGEDPNSTLSTLSDVSSYGATGWKRFRPGNPGADLGVFLGELRDIPRMLRGTAKYFHELWRSMGGSATAFKPKRVADAWLNTQFGWMPFISDLRKFYKTYTTLNDRLDRIRRENGKWVRRGGTVTSSVQGDVVSSSATGTLHYPVLPSYMYVSTAATGNHTISKMYSQKVWFEGRFRYWIEDIDSPTWEARTIIELFGAMPCPSLLWELCPWSWLVDWGSNFGDVIANMSSGYADNLAAKYAYVMGTTMYECKVDSTCTLNSGALHGSWTFPVEWKRRVAASPFGFGLTEDDFTLRQWSILSALGITHLPR